MSPPAPPVATRWPRVLLLVAAGVAAALHIGKVPPAMPDLRADLGLDLVGAGWVLSLIATIGAAAGTAIGAGADAVGHRRGVLLGMALLTGGSLLGSLSALAPGGAAALFAGRAVEGAGSILVAVSVPALIWRSAAPRDVRFAFGLWGAWLPLGVSAMMAASPFLLARFDWPAVWWAASAVSALVGVALAVETRGMPAGARTGWPGASVVLAVGRSPAAWTLAGSFFLYSLCFMTVLGFLPTFLTEERGLAADASSWLVGVAVLFNAIGNVLAGWLAMRGLRRWALVGIAFAAMAACAAGIFSTALPVAAGYALCLLYSVLGGLLPATVMGAAPAFAPRPQLVSSTSGMVMQGSYLGQLAGAPLVGLLASRLGWGAVPLFVAASCLTGCALALALRAQERRVERRSHPAQA
ncbi:CynX/NimT family MFS transporter [Azospirillum sp.]|uniref:MFS transporter n=1 Tax=Azospirillum sp. TaxID=34012 RepID=UPI002D6BD29E|nr:MFS transporter [Azospirillum sp.]HYD69706.1 MFS transporter [Azospirillum sp.]